MKTFEATPSEAQAVREALNDTYPDAKEHLDNLFRFIEPFGYAPANRLYRPGLEVDQNAVSAQLACSRRKRQRELHTQQQLRRLLVSINYSASQKP